MEIDIAKLAKLAKLRLTPEEIEKMSTQLPLILEYVGKLREVDTSNVDPKAYLTDATNVFRADEPRVNESERQAVVNAFPKRAGDMLEVPAVFE